MQLPDWLENFSISLGYSARLLSFFYNALHEKVMLNTVAYLVNGVVLDSFRLLQILDLQLSAFHLALH